MADDGTKLIIVLEAQSKKLQNSLVDVNRQIDRFAAATERRFDSMQKKSDASFAKLATSFRSSVGGLQGALAPLLGTLGVKEILDYADAWIVAGNKIAAAGSVAGLQARSLNELKDSANATRTSLEEYVDLYSRLLRASTTVGASEMEVAKVTDIVAKSLKAGGASAQEQAASLIQLGQALSSGFLQGDELRSLRENAPLLARAIAKAYGVTIGELKQLGAEGKLTSDKVFKAILSGGDEIEAAFKTTRVTIHDAFTIIGNDFTAYIGNAGQSSGATKALIDSLLFLADHFKEVGDAVATFATILAVTLTGKAVAGLVIGLGEAIAALATFLSALQAGTLTAATFTAALGPISIIAAAAAVAIGYLVYQNGEGARTAKAHADALTSNASAIDAANDASKEYRDSLRRQIELQIEDAKTSVAAAKAKYDFIDALGRAAGASAILAGGLVGADYKARQDAGEGAYNLVVGNSTTGQSLSESQAYLDKLEKQLAELNDKGPGKPGSGGGVGGGGGESPQEKYKRTTDRVIDQTEVLLKQTEAQKALNPLVNDYGFAVDFAKTKQELLQAAQKAQLPVTKDLATAIDFLAGQSAQAAVDAAKLTEAEDEARQKAADYFSTAKDAARGFIDDLRQGKTAAEALGDVFDKLADKAIDVGLTERVGDIFTLEMAA
jgi:tape measure domain-containing protein